MEEEAISLLKKCLNYIDYTRFEFGEDLDEDNLEEQIILFLKNIKIFNIE